MSLRTGPLFGNVHLPAADRGNRLSPAEGRRTTSVRRQPVPQRPRNATGAPGRAFPSVLPSCTVPPHAYTWGRSPTRIAQTRRHACTNPRTTAKHMNSRITDGVEMLNVTSLRGTVPCMRLRRLRFFPYMNAMPGIIEQVTTVGNVTGYPRAGYIFRPMPHWATQ